MITGGGDLAARREAAASWEFSSLFLTYKTHPSLLTNSFKAITSYSTTLHHPTTIAFNLKPIFKLLKRKSFIPGKVC